MNANERFEYMKCKACGKRIWFWRSVFKVGNGDVIHKKCVIRIGI